MKIILALTLAIGLLCSPVCAQAPGPDGLYFRMKMAFGTFSQDHWWFLKDGRYLNSVPSGGLDPAAFETTCQKIPTACGTYKVEGAAIQMTPRNGKPFTLRFRQIGDGNLELDGLFTKHVEKFGSNAKLDGHYSWSGGASGGGTAVSASRGYQFNPDGTFSTSSLAGVSAGKFGESSAGAGSGTYKLSGNILELTSGGKTTIHIAYPYSLGTEVRLNLDGEMYKKDR